MGGFLVIWSPTNFRKFLNYFDTTQCNLISGQSIPWYLLPSIFLLLSKDNSQIFHISKENIITIAVNWQAIFATLVCPCSLTQMEAEMTCHLSQISLKPRLLLLMTWQLFSARQPGATEERCGQYCSAPAVLACYNSFWGLWDTAQKQSRHEDYLIYVMVLGRPRTWEDSRDVQNCFWFSHHLPFPPLVLFYPV